MINLEYVEEGTMKTELVQFNKIQLDLINEIRELVTKRLGESRLYEPSQPFVLSDKKSLAFTFNNSTVRGLPALSCVYEVKITKAPA